MPLYFCPVVSSSIFSLAYSQPSQIGCLPAVAEDLSVWWLGPRRFVTLVRSAVYKLSYLLTYLLTYAESLQLGLILGRRSE